MSGATDIVAYLRERPWGLAFTVAAGEDPALRGEGAVIGLIDAALEAGIDDLAGASLRERCFARRPAIAHALRDHGTCSATLLVGQGARHVLGMAPRARVFVATVSEDDGTARPERVADGIDWLLEIGVKVLAVPMGDRDWNGALDDAVSRAAAHGVAVFAARGDDPGGAPMFPARHRTVRCIGADPALAVPAVGSDGAARLCVGSSIACVLAAGAEAVQRTQTRP